MPREEKPNQPNVEAPKENEPNHNIRPPKYLQIKEGLDKSKINKLIEKIDKIIGPKNKR